MIPPCPPLYFFIIIFKISLQSTLISNFIYSIEFPEDGKWVNKICGNINRGSTPSFCVCNYNVEKPELMWKIQWTLLYLDGVFW